MQPQRFKIDLRRLADDRGSAVLEFVGFGLLLQVPLLVMAVNLAQVQQNQLAAEAVARHSLRSYILTNIPVDETAAEILRDFAVSEDPNFKLDCWPSNDCEASGEIITLRVQLGQSNAYSTMRRP